MWSIHERDFIVAPEDYNLLQPGKMPGCNVPFEAGRLSDGPTTKNRRLLWKVAKGVTGISQEEHCHDHWLRFIAGSGIFCIDGEDHLYTPGSEFMVYAWQSHGIKRADEDTIVLQINPPDPRAKPKVF